MVDLHDIQKLASDIAAKFDVKRIVLFGSYAYGTPREDSDVDLLVAMNYEGPRLRTRMDIWRSTRPPFACDIRLYRPDELMRRYREHDPIPRIALDQGRTLYERDRA